MSSIGRVHTITGRVTTDSGTAIPAADVIVMIAPTTESIGGHLRRLPPPIFSMVTSEHPQGRFFFGF